MTGRSRGILVLPVTLLIAGVAGMLSGYDGGIWQRVGDWLAPKTNVLLITLDTVRADHLSAYGYRRRTSPAIERLAAEGALFSQATAAAPWTTPSLFSLATGTPPHRHGVSDWGKKMSPELSTLADLLRQRGYRTALFNNHQVFFQLQEDIAHGFQEVISLSDEESPAGDVVDRTVAWMEKNRPPFFVWVHLFDPHEPFSPPAPYDSLFGSGETPLSPRVPSIEGGFGAGGIPRYVLDGMGSGASVDRIIAAYDGEIRYTDDQVGRLLKAFDSLPASSPSLVVLTADHGEILERPDTPFHGAVYFSHGTYLFEELLRVPLVIRFPQKIPPGRIVERAVGLTDLAPTILDALDLPPPHQMEGRSLLPLLFEQEQEGNHQGERPERPLLSEELRNRWSAIRWGRFKLIDYGYGRQVLYDLERDPFERSDLAEEKAPVAAVLLARMRRMIGSGERAEALPEAAPLGEDVRRKLRALGYLDDGR